MKKLKSTECRKQLEYLCQLTHAVLSLAHPNADFEKNFSIVRNIQTEKKANRYQTRDDCEHLCPPWT
jgi:hypothetical protein